MINGISWFLVPRRRVLFKRRQRHLHGLFQLWIPAFAPRLGIELHFDIRVGTMILHFPLAIGIPEREVRRGD